MKKITIIVSLVLFVNTLKAQVNKEYYENGNLKTIEETRGIKKSYYENGQLSSIGFQNEGWKIGEWKAYHENGQLSAIGSFSGGIKIGEWKTYHDNGKLERIGSVDELGTIGEWKFYHKNGELESIGVLKKGKRIGDWKTYHNNGQLKSSISYDLFLYGKYNFNRKKGEWKTYSDTGKLKSVGSYNENGSKTEDWIFYDENGFLYFIHKYSKGVITTAKEFYENGQLNVISEYKNGVKTGEWKSYYESGQLETIGKLYKGNKTGDWKSYGESGVLIETKNYINEEYDQFENEQRIQYQNEQKIISAWQFHTITTTNPSCRSADNFPITYLKFMENGKVEFNSKEELNSADYKLSDQIIFITNLHENGRKQDGKFQFEIKSLTKSTLTLKMQYECGSVDIIFKK